MAKYVCQFCKHEIDVNQDATLVICPNCCRNIGDEAVDVQIGQDISGYEILELLGSGGMGDVYLARQKNINRKVAMKILQPALAENKNYLERFFREVRTLAQIQHPNIVQALEAGIEDKICFFTMMYIPGKDLMSRLETELRFQEQEAITIVRVIAEALKYVWEKHKVIHRDIKPANIIVTPEGEVKLMDLGISKQVDSKQEDSLTIAGMMVGSPHYISPEQARGRRDLDFCTDMYSLGATLYHLLTGVTPYHADSGMGVIACHLTEPVPDPAKVLGTISLDVCRLVQRMMAKDKTDRFSSWDEVICEMDHVLATHGGKQTELEHDDKLYKVKQYVKGFFGLDVPANAINKYRRLHRLIFLLLVTLTAFAYVVHHSVYVTRQKKIKAFYDEGMRYSNMPLTSKNLRKATYFFEQVEKFKEPQYSSRARNQRERLFKRYMAAKKARKTAFMKESWDKLKQTAFQWEKVQDYDTAISFWKRYQQEGPLRKKIAAKIAKELEYLYRQKERKDKGLLNE